MSGQDAPGITVIGLDGERLGEHAAAALAAATCVAGSRRHLDSVALPDGAHRIPIANLAEALDELLSRGDASAVVLASGDPGFFGIVRALRERGTRPRVIPAVSSVATAFARIGVPWDDAVVVSAHGRADHGRSARRALAAALAHPKAAILTAPGATAPSAFLPELLRAGREVYVAQRLGTSDETVTRVHGAEGTADWAHPNIVLALAPEHVVAPAMTWMPGHQGAPDGWALPEERFEHRRSMVTKSEVRAVALAHLAPRPGTVVWDVGAGSGSVAVECARFGAHAVAFERNPEDCERARANARAHGVTVDVREGRVPEVLDEGAGAVAPDAVFFGGGDDAAITGTLRRHRPDRVVTALASVDRVRATRDTLVAHGYTAEGTQLQASRLADLPNGSLRLAAANPVTLVWGSHNERGAEV